MYVKIECQNEKKAPKNNIKWNNCSVLGHKTQK